MCHFYRYKWHADTHTEAQRHSMYELLKDLTKEYPGARIMGHCELPHVVKKCPGFPASKYYAELQPENR
jgi:N-acetyl-anhydromuramyl-L-alanine amidase AmpD